MKSRGLYRLCLLAMIAIISLACNVGGILGLGATATPEATSTPEATNTPRPSPTPEFELDEEQRVAEGGFSFRPVPDYSLDITYGIVSMLAPGGDPDNGPVINIFGGAGTYSTADELFQEMTNQTDVTIAEPQPVMIGGVEGLAADITQTGTDEMGRTGGGCDSLSWPAVCYSGGCTKRSMGCGA